jgi:UDP-N-acetylglucosamine enolpyruvyl transferase
MLEFISNMIYIVCDMSENYKAKVGRMIQDQRLARQMTQSQLAKSIGTSQSAINRIEKGNQNISLEMLARISEVLENDIISLNRDGKTNFRINGGKKLSGNIDVKTSKNAAVALLCACLLNKGKTTLRNVAKIEEVNRLIEVLVSVGVNVQWLENSNDLEIKPPKVLKLNQIDNNAAKRTRSIIMFLGPLLYQYHSFSLPFAGGCNLGTRTIEPHILGLQPFGMNVITSNNKYKVESNPKSVKESIVLTERGNTVTENILMAAALQPSEVTIKNASNDYMVIDLCHFLVKLGAKIDGIGSTTLKITGKNSFNKNFEFYPGEDPIEAMSLITAGIITNSQITVKRIPIDYLEVELAVLRSMGLKYTLSDTYLSNNEFTNLADISLLESSLVAPKDKLTTFPSAVNMDNLPFLGLIATAAKGRTLLHDWPYENRAIYFTYLSPMNATIELVDPHRVYISGPTKWRAADLVAPPALRPSVVVMLAMLAAPGESILRDVYNIQRGYEGLPERLNSLGADIQTINSI